MNYFNDIYKNNKYLDERRKFSQIKIELIKKELICNTLNKDYITIFSAGSLGRREFGEMSDIDLFVISKKTISNLEQIEILAELIRINKELNFPPFSNDGKFLKIYSLENLIKNTGSPEDDVENLFTTRILLLLESVVLINSELYVHSVRKILENYFRDSVGHDDFKPLYLINDFLRYWRTLCLNYEQIRSDKNRPWRKKNINLKYSRMITVFGTILPIIAKPYNNIEEMYNLCNLPTMERFASGLDYLSDENLIKEYHDFIDLYVNFIKAKEIEDIEKDEHQKKQLNDNASLFSDFIYKALNHKNIRFDYRKYLII